MLTSGAATRLTQSGRAESNGQRLYRQRAELFCTAQIRELVPNGFGQPEIRTEMIRKVQVIRHGVFAVHETVGISDICCVSPSEGMQLIIFASVPAIAAFFICLAITMSR